jgi:hypothetical protein
MFKGVKGIVAFAAAAILVVAIAYGMASNSAQSDGVREAYEIAARDPALLSQLHCYCGCDKSLGHKSLLDCYRDDHASRCGICMGEARDAEPMASRGMAIEQIRDALRTRYSHGS